METTAQSETDLLNLAPPIGGFCADCGHMAVRHQGSDCKFGELRDSKEPCECAGMLWQGRRFEMDPVSGAIRVLVGREQLEAERALLHDEIDARNIRLDEIRDELAGLPE